MKRENLVSKKGVRKRNSKLVEVGKEGFNASIGKKTAEENAGEYLKRRGFIRRGGERGCVREKSKRQRLADTEPGVR